MPRVSAEDRRRDLIEAAFKVMARVGVSAATTRLIAAEAGVPQSIFHYCFRSKDELFQELTQTVVASMLGSAMDSLIEADTFGESVRRSLQELWSPAVKHPDHQLVLYELTTAMLRDPAGAEMARWQYEQYFDHTGKLLEALAERADMTWNVPLDVLSRMTTTMVDGVILGWLTDRNTDDVTRTIDQFAQYLATQASPKPMRVKKGAASRSLERGRAKAAG
jgi:AcrR family transcriptional regulator